MKVSTHLKDDQKKWTMPQFKTSVTVKDLNTYDHVRFQFFFFSKSSKNSKILLFFVNMGCFVYINEEKNELT